MGVEVEEIICLVPNEVMTATRPTARNSHGLRHLECCLKGGMVDWCDAIDAYSNAENDERGLKLVICVFL